MRKTLPFVLLACTVLAQDLRLRDLSVPVAAAYDSIRGRTVVLGSRGETSELVPGQLRQRAVALRSSWAPVLCFDSVRGATWHLDSDFAAATFEVLTARYDGGSWTDVVSPVRPSPRSAFSATFDDARGEVLLFGGATPVGLPLGDTWTFDGSVWTQQNPASAPSPRSGAGLANDVARSRVVLFGGGAGTALDDTWEWDGLTWTQRVTAVRPSPRHGVAMAFDALRNRTVLCAGVGLWPSFPADDTWEWDGQAWTQVVSPTPRPSDRYLAPAVFDAVLGEVVLVGGYGAGRSHRDVWSFDGVRWQPGPIQTQRPFLPFANQMIEPGGTSVLSFGGFDDNDVPTAESWRWDGFGWTSIASTGPSARVRAATCTSPSHAWLFGGDDYGSSTTLFGDLWRWDGSSWAQIAAAGPTARTGAAMTFDLQRNEIVLFGGAGIQPLGDTWTFDGTSWQQRTPATSPPPRWSPGMAYDPVLDRVVLCGGYGGFPLNDTWLWDGTGWALVPTAIAPPVTVTSAAFDVQRAQVVLRSDGNNGGAEAWAFDGQAWNLLGPLPFSLHQINGVSDGQILGLPYTGGTLVADGLNLMALSATAAQAVPYGNACGIDTPQVAADSWPRLGAANFALEITGAPANSLALLLGAVQSANVPIGGCTQLVMPGQAAALFGTSAIGTADAALPIPSAVSFLGVDLFFQAATLDPSAPMGFALSRGLQLTIGD